MKKVLSRLNLKLVESRGKYGALLKNRELVNDAIFIQNISNWNECFSEKFTTDSLPREKINRIIDAYNAAMRDMTHRHLYYISDEWIPLYKKYMGEVINVLLNRDSTRLSFLYDNFFRQDFSSGLCGLPTNMRRFYHGNPNQIDKRWYLIDACYRINLLKNKIPTLDAQDLSVAKVGNPYGFYWGDTFIRNGADYHYYYAELVKKLTLKNKEKNNIRNWRRLRRHGRLFDERWKN